MKEEILAKKKKCNALFTVAKTWKQPQWPSLNSLQITDAGEGVEKREPSYTVGGNVSWCSHCGNGMEVPQKTKNRVTT